MPAIQTPPKTAPARRTDFRQVIRELEALCDGLQPGDRIPTRTELMERFDASQRAVLAALDDLRRRGKIVIRHGSGTFKARPLSFAIPINGDSEVEPAATGTVVAILKPDESFFVHAAKVLYDCAALAGLAVTCHLIDPENPATLALPNVDSALGYVVFHQGLLPLGQELQEAGHRVVLYGLPPAGGSPGLPNVHGNHEHGGYLATRHLLDLGHRSLLIREAGRYFKGPRYRGEMRAIAEANRRGQDVAVSWVSDEQFQSWRDSPETLRALFAGERPPTGLIAWNDQEAATILNLLSYVGVRVPEDVSLVGYDNLPLSTASYPALTTVDGNVEQQIQAVLALLTQPEAPSAQATSIALPTLIRRDSSAAPAR